MDIKPNQTFKFIHDKCENELLIIEPTKNKDEYYCLCKDKDTYNIKRLSVQTLDNMNCELSEDGHFILKENICNVLWNFTHGTHEAFLKWIGMNPNSSSDKSVLYKIFLTYKNNFIEIVVASASKYHCAFNTQDIYFVKELNSEQISNELKNSKELYDYNMNVHFMKRKNNVLVINDYETVLFSIGNSKVINEMRHFTDNLFEIPSTIAINSIHI